MSKFKVTVEQVIEFDIFENNIKGTAEEFIKKSLKECVPHLGIDGSYYRFETKDQVKILSIEKVKENEKE